MFGKNNGNIQECNAIPDKDMNKGILEDNEQDSVKRHTASESYELGKNVRAKLNDELLDEIYKAINKAAELGQLDAAVDVNYEEYKGVLDNALSELESAGYKVKGTVRKVNEWAGNLAYSRYLITVSWDKHKLNKEM